MRQSRMDGGEGTAVGTVAPAQCVTVPPAAALGVRPAPALRAPAVRFGGALPREQRARENAELARDEV